MHALGQHLDGEDAVHQAAQRRGAPELAVIAAARIEADDERRRADTRRELVEISRQVEAAALLAALDQDHAAPVRPLVLVQLPERRDGAEHRVAVVGAAAAVELALLDHRRPRAEPLAPAGHLGLLVEVAVEEHGVFGGSGARHVDQQARRAAFEPHDLELHPRDRVALAPLRGEPRRLIDIAVRLPVAVEVRRLRRDADVLDERRDDGVVPQLLNGFQGPTSAAGRSRTRCPRPCRRNAARSAP